MNHLCCAGLFAGLVPFAPAATMTMAGRISDNCDAASHENTMAMHAETKMTDRDLALSCVKDGGKYVFIADGQVYEITNQNQVDLANAPGNYIRLTGDVNGTTISVINVSIATVYFTGDANLGGGGDSVCQEYYGPGAFDITASEGGGGVGTVCAVYPSRRRN